MSAGLIVGIVVLALMLIAALLLLGTTYRKSPRIPS